MTKYFFYDKNNVTTCLQYMYNIIVYVHVFELITYCVAYLDFQKSDKI